MGLHNVTKRPTDAASQACPGPASKVSLRFGCTSGVRQSNGVNVYHNASWAAARWLENSPRPHIQIDAKSDKGYVEESLIIISHHPTLCIPRTWFSPLQYEFSALNDIFLGSAK